VSLATFALGTCLALAGATAPPTPRVAILIDDIGYQPAADLDALGLAGAYSYAVLPHAPHGARFSAAANALGRDSLLHLPMEAEHSNNLLGPGALRRRMDETAMTTTLAAALASVAPVVGINNHMGSRLTREPRAMRRLALSLGRAAPRLFFVDSRTTPRTVAADVLRKAGIPVLERDVFLDHLRNPSAIRRQLERLVRLAHRRGSALGIGHPYRETLSVLRGFRPGAAGVRLVPVSALVGNQTVGPLRTAANAGCSDAS
jgi:polysaccharide deacetylase 2 family uncharacterized protein YibQ